MTAYLSAEEVRSRVPALATRPSDDDTAIDDSVAEFAERAEDYIEYSLVPRTVTAEQHQVDYGVLQQTTTSSWWPAFVRLNHRKVTAITTVTINGTTISSDLYQLGTDGRTLYFRPQIISAITGPAFGLVLVTYTHGLAVLPERAKRACALYCRATVLSDNSGTPRDVISQSAGDGTYTRFSTPDAAARRPTGYLEVDAILNSLLETSRRPAVA